MDIIDANLEQKLYDILKFVQQYRDANQKGESLKQFGESLKAYSETLEAQKKLEHLLYCARYNMRDREEDKPIIHGNKVTVFFRDPTRLD